MEIDTTVVLISWSPSKYRMKLLTKSFALIKQTKRPHILVVVDNGPKEQTDWLVTQDIDIHVQNTVNIGVGAARNQGAKQTKTEFIAFVDSDVCVFPEWLDVCIDCLKKYPDEKYIAAPAKSVPMRYDKYKHGENDGFELWRRCAGFCLVMRRKDFEILGGFSTCSTPGHQLCAVMNEKGYLFIHHPSWNAKHLGRYASYDWRNKLVNGVWVPDPKNEKLFRRANE